MMSIIAAILSAVGSFAICFVFFREQTDPILFSQVNYREAIAVAIFVIVLRGYGNSK